MSSVSVVENILERTSFDNPKVLNTSDYSATYNLYVPKSKAGYESDPYTSDFTTGQRIDIGIDAQSNEITDFRRSYLIFEDQLEFRHNWATANDFNTAFTEDWSQFPILDSGIPFSQKLEKVNGKTEIDNCTSNFNRFATGEMMATPHVGKAVSYWSGLASFNKLNDSSHNPAVNNGWIGFVNDCVNGYELTEYKSLVTDVFIRRQYIKAIHDGDGRIDYDFRRTCVIPLPVISRIGRSSYYIPTGLLSQTSVLGWELRLVMAVVQNLYALVNAGLNTNIISTSLRYRIYEPYLICRTISIQNQSILDMYIGDFNLEPRREVIGTEENENGQVVPVTTSIQKRILVPYIACQYEQNRVLSNTRTIRLNYNVEQKGLKGMMIRVSQDSIFTDTSIDSNMSDVKLPIRTIQVSIGSLKIPDNVIANKIGNALPAGNSLFRNYELFSYLVNDARHIFDPYQVYQPTGDPNTGHGIPFTQGIVPGVAPLYISFENFAMNNAESTLGAVHSYGVNTFLLGNVVKLVIELNEVLGNDITVESQFAYQEMLLVQNGQIQNAFNLTILNSPDQIQ
jgi:uncharacterized protein YkvS